MGLTLPALAAECLSSSVGMLVALLFIVHWDQPLHGAALALTCQDFTNAFFSCVFFACSTQCRSTWGGWSTRAVSEWGSYLRLALPATLMLCCEW